MIAKTIVVKARFTDQIIPVKANFINQVVEKKGRQQERTITPTEVDQIVEPEAGFSALSQVFVKAIPSNYGRIEWNGSTLTVS